jgi:peroxiredoxin/predicted 2-oxoglutarate/Fe(II)-dependent dioxygenase YbiX
MTIQPLSVGEPAPWFSAIGSNDRNTVAFDEFAGRHIVLFFFGSAARPAVAEVLAEFERHKDLFDYKRALFLGISNDPGDFNEGRVRPQYAGQIYLWDTDGTAAKQYHVSALDTEVSVSTIRPVAFILSPTLQILEIVRLTEPAAFIGHVLSTLRDALKTPPGVLAAPVLVVPDVFDRAFCRQLVDLYDSVGGREIGAIEKKGKVVEQFDPKFRKRLDYYITDKENLQRARELLERRLLPLVYRAFQFPTTRIERYLVGCYDAETGGYFRPHRDNTIPVVAHRRFAVTINLNDGYEGGNLCFPEFGHQSYCTPPGHAIVFSCSLLHEVMPVTRDRRYAFLSFFYDERSQQIRDAYIKAMEGPQNAAGR